MSEQIRMSRELVTLRDDVPVTEPWRDFAVRDPEPATLLGFIDTMEFRTLGRRVREHFAKEQRVQTLRPRRQAMAQPWPRPERR